MTKKQRINPFDKAYAASKADQTVDQAVRDILYAVSGQAEAFEAVYDKINLGRIANRLQDIMPSLADDARATELAKALYDEAVDANVNLVLQLRVVLKSLVKRASMLLDYTEPTLKSTKDD